MDLQTYCEKNGGTARRGCPVLSKLAADTGFSADTLYMVARGHKRPGSVMARLIAVATHDEVSREGLRPDVFGAEPVRAGEGA
jgi:DNA-binding transcriptional regulator YdaS (Cro superfamily)